MLPSIGTLCGSNKKGTEPLFGVEIEVEGNNLPRVIKGWETVHEGSLRAVNGENGIEYIFSRPSNLKESVERVVAFDTAMGQDGANPIFSSRTSVHVHVDVRDFSIAQWFNYIVLWGIFEEPLIDFCGEERKGNLFCLSMKDAEGINSILRNVLITRRLNYNENAIRYAAVNIAATRKFGSLEFRCMRGTKEANIIVPWLEILSSLRNAALRYDKPEEILEHVIMNPSFFIEECGIAHSDIIKTYPDFERVMREAAYRLIFLFDGMDWNSFVFIDEPSTDI